MSMTRAARFAANVSTGLGVANWSRWWIAMGVAIALASGVGFWAGGRWQRGAQALSSIEQRNAEVKALETAARDLRQAGVNIAQDYRTAATRMESIANGYDEQDRRTLARFERTLADAREPLLRDRADLWACDIGRELLAHWNSSAAGPASTAAAPAADPRNAADAVRADAAGDGQPRAGAADPARRGDGQSP